MRTIWTDCGSVSFQCHTSTLALGSPVSSGSASCSLIPKNSRVPSLLQLREPNSLTTIPVGNEPSVVGSNTTAFDLAVPSPVQA